MNLPISIERYQEIAGYCEDQEMDSIWYSLARDGLAFSDRRDTLLWVVRRLLEEGRIKLVNMRSHVPLAGSIDEQIEQMRAAFPKDEVEMDNGIWFLLENCPAGSVWQHQPES